MTDNPIVSPKIISIVILGDILYKTWNETIQLDYLSTVMTEGQYIFKEEPSVSIWKTLNEYYVQYGCLPSDVETLHTIITDQSHRDWLEVAVDTASDPDDRAQFALDKGREILKTNIMASAVTKAYTNLELGRSDTALALLENMFTELGKVDVADSTYGIHDSADVIGLWKKALLPAQQGLIPVGIPGLANEYPGTPAGELNYVVAGYGAGKSTIMCGMVAEKIKLGPCLYVTLEMPAVNILFKMLANYSDGVLSVSDAFEVPETIDGVKLQYIENLKLPNKLYILDMPASSITAGNLGQHIAKLKREQGVDIRHCFVDYGDLLKSDQGGQGDLGWQYMTEVATELHSVAKKFNLDMWTVSQAGKETFSEVGGIRRALPMSGKNLYGAKGKLHTGCLGFGLMLYKIPNHTRYALGFLSTLKNRYGEFTGHHLVCVDYATATIEAIEPIDEEIIYQYETVNKTDTPWGMYLLQKVKDFISHRTVDATIKNNKSPIGVQKPKALDTQFESVTSPKSVASPKSVTSPKSVAYPKDTHLRVVPNKNSIPDESTMQDMTDLIQKAKNKQNKVSDLNIERQPIRDDSCKPSFSGKVEKHSVKKGKASLLDVELDFTPEE
jgi:hypothetical protein